MKFAVNGRPIGLQAVLHSSVLVFIFFAADGLCASEDDYLKALEAESEKIGGVGQTVDAAGGKEDKTTVRSQRVAFDTYLQTKHKGTYAFYHKLPERSQEEIFKAFLAGLSMDEVRHMVIDRKMNR